MSVLIFVILTIVCIMVLDLFWGIIGACLILWSWGGFNDDGPPSTQQVVEISVNQQYCLETFKTLQVRNTVNSDGTRASYCVVNGELELIATMY